MLEFRRKVRDRMILTTRLLMLLVPVVCIVLLLSQTAFARTTYRIHDGGQVLIYTTSSTDPNVVLSEAGVALGAADTFTTLPGNGIADITIQRTQTVTVRQGDSAFQIQTNGETVVSLLRRSGIYLTEQDVVSVPLDAETYDGMVITLSRGTKTTLTYTVEIPYETVYCYDSSLPAGQQVVLTQGVTGQLFCTANVFYVNEQEVSRTVLTETVVLQPVNAVIAIGTGPKSV